MAAYRDGEPDRGAIAGGTRDEQSLLIGLLL